MKLKLVALGILTGMTALAEPTIWMVGDSTMANCSEKSEPMAGWGQVLDEFCKPGVTVENKARGGRSSKSFINEKRFAFADKMNKGDFLIIQFGHNDQKKEDPKRYTDPDTTFPEYLMVYIKAAREKEVTPVLATSIARRHFDKDGKVLQSLGKYPDAIRKLAKDENIALVDLNKITMEEYQKLGDEESTKLFTHLARGENPNYPKGIKDNTHLNRNGAETIAGWFVEDAKKQKLSIAEVFK